MRPSRFKDLVDRGILSPNDSDMDTGSQADVHFILLDPTNPDTRAQDYDVVLHKVEFLSEKLLSI